MRHSVSHNFKIGATGQDKKLAIEALVMLGYPIGRYLRLIAAESGFAGVSPKFTPGCAQRIFKS